MREDSLFKNQQEIVSVKPPEERRESELSFSEASRGLREINQKGDVLLEKTSRELQNYVDGSIDVRDLQAKLLEAKRQFKFDEHFNFVEMFNMVSFKQAVEKSYEELSGNSKELYALFVSKLPPESFDNTLEAAAEIAQTYLSFTEDMRVARKNEAKPSVKDRLKNIFKSSKGGSGEFLSFMDKYYAPFVAASKRREEEQTAGLYEGDLAILDQREKDKLTAWL